MLINEYLQMRNLMAGQEPISPASQVQKGGAPNASGTAAPQNSPFAQALRQKLEEAQAQEETAGQDVLPDDAGISSQAAFQASAGISSAVKRMASAYELPESGVAFSKHALERINQRSIDMNEGNKLERLNRAVEAASLKGSSETLVLLDQTAFVVSVKNNKVITTLSAEDLQGNVFTNIDSTVIM